MRAFDIEAVVAERRGDLRGGLPVVLDDQHSAHLVRAQRSRALSIEVYHSVTLTHEPAGASRSPRRPVGAAR